MNVTLVFLMKKIYNEYTETFQEIIVKNLLRLFFKNENNIGVTITGGDRYYPGGLFPAGLFH